MTLSCKYLIVGGGMTADAAVHGIRELDKTGAITVLSAESHPPYDRPPLSKKLWTGKPFDSIWRKTSDAGIDLRLGCRALVCDPTSHTVTDHHGQLYKFEKLLLATGAVPKRLPFPHHRVIYLRGVDDYQHIRALADTGAHFVVIGGGFIGSEISAALAINGCRVSMIFPAAGIGSSIYPQDLSNYLTRYYSDKGVTVLPGESVTAIVDSVGRTTVHTDGARTIECDAVIAGVGVEPEIDLARSIGLSVDNGIVVDEFLRTTHADIYASGDVANFYNPALRMRLRVEHEDNANTMGATAGRNMAGNSETYDYLPYFYSDLFDFGYEAVGELSSQMTIVQDWKKKFHKGVLYYLRDGLVRGVLLWNVWGQLDAARHLIATNHPVSKTSLIGRIGD